MYTSLLLSLASAALIGSAEAAGEPPIGLNYGNQKGQGFKDEADYVKEFTAAQKLKGTNGAFTSARIYTCVQGGTKDDANAAFSAAVKTKTSLLLGLWTSGDPAGFDNELSALAKGLNDNPDVKIDGISVGSEDLYRISPIGILNKSGVGLGPDELVKYIQRVRETLKTAGDGKFKDAPIGHVDTWTSWVNGTNKPVIDNCDWLGVDAYPYWQATMPNNISMAGTLFFDAIDKTKKAAGDKPVWITETGWPVVGNKSNMAIAEVPEAEMFYQGVGCKILGKEPTWWYILNEKGANPDFSIADTDYNPLFDLNCADAKKADPLMEGSAPSGNSIDNPVGDDSGSNSTASATGTSTSGGESSKSTTSSAPSGTSTSAASATRAANAVFGLVLAGVVALMI